MDVEQHAAAPEFKPFNFSRAGMVAPDQMRSLRTLDEQFARNLTHTLGAWMRTTVTVVPLSPEQQIYSQFADSTAVSHHVLPLRMEPLHTRGALSCDLSLAPAIIDLLLGGSGRASALSRELTEIEESVLSSVLDIVLREWNTVWQPFGPEFYKGYRERGGQGERLMSLMERTYCSRYQMTLADMTGEIVFCLPAASITSTLRAFAHRRERQRSRTPEERERMARRVAGAQVHATMHFPVMRLRAEDLRSMTPGNLLPLPLSPGAVAEICVGGEPTFRAQLVRSGGHRAGQILGTVMELPAGATANGAGRAAEMDRGGPPV